MIKRILALRYVCKKYDLKCCWWTLLGDRGFIGFVEENKSDRYEFIGVSLFSKHFWSILSVWLLMQRRIIDRLVL